MVKYTSSDSIWQHRTGGRYALIGTSAQLRRDGTAVLAAGVARQAAGRHIHLEHLYGEWISGRSAPNPFGTAELYINDDLGLVLSPVCGGEGAPKPVNVRHVLWAAAAAAVERGVDLVAANDVCGCGVVKLEDVDGIDDIFSAVDLFVCTAP